MSTRATADNGSDVTVQVNKGASWAVAKIQVKAIEVVDSYYELYNAGGTIEINGIKIQKDGADGYGEATLITSESESKEISRQEFTSSNRELKLRILGPELSIT